MWRAVPKVVVMISLFFIAGAASQLGDRIDLERVLRDPAAMNALVILYKPNMEDSLYVYGNGRVVFQSHAVQMSDELVPTCKGKLQLSQVRELVEAIHEHHFFDLPQRSYYFMTASDDADDFWKALKLHTIVLDDGETRAQRSFAEGMYQGVREPIPPDFAAIEVLLQKIRSDDIGGACHIAPGIKLPELSPRVVR